MRKQKVLFLVFLVYTLAIAGCGVFNNDPAKQANQKIGITPAEKEKARLLRRIDSSFSDPEAHYELGKLYQADALWGKADQQYSITLGFDPVHRQAQAARVKVLQMLGDKSKSELLADIYINGASNDPMSSLKLALGFQEQELDDYALQCYQQALRLAPNSAKINKQIGYYYLSKNKDVQARDYLTRSFQLDANQPDVAGVLGRLGVPVAIPRKVQKNTQSLDREVDKMTKEMMAK